MGFRLLFCGCIATAGVCHAIRAVVNEDVAVMPSWLMGRVLCPGGVCHRAQMVIFFFYF